MGQAVRWSVGWGGWKVPMSAEDGEGILNGEVCAELGGVVESEDLFGLSYSLLRGSSGAIDLRVGMARSLVVPLRLLSSVALQGLAVS